MKILFPAKLLLMACLCLLFTGCYDSREIDELGYVLAVGIDKGESGFAKSIFQVAVPKNISGGGNEKGGSGGGGSESTINTTIESHTLPIALNMVNTYFSHQLHLSNAKAIVISEEVAKEGIGQYLQSIIRNREFRPNLYIVISRTSAEDYLKSVIPLIEANPAKYYELNYDSYKYNGLSPGSTVNDFYYAIESSDSEGVAILASVNKFSSSNEINMNANTSKEKGKTYPSMTDFKAGDIPRSQEPKGEIMGSAVFKGDKMVGELDGEETQYYLMTTGKFKSSNLSLPDPKNPTKSLALNISQSRRPKIDLKIQDGKPKINVKVSFDADFLSIQSGENYESPQRIEEIETYVSEIIKRGMLKTFEKCAKKYHSDIFGFGSRAKKLVLTWNDWKKTKWREIFKNSEFNVTVKLKIRRPGLIIRSTKID